MNDNQTIKDIILWQRIGCIAVRLAERLNISPEAALDLFYKSKTCEKLHDKNSDLNLFGDLYIVDEVLREMQSHRQ